MGDLHELYSARISRGDQPLRASLWYWTQVLRLGFPFLCRRTVRRRFYRRMAQNTAKDATDTALRGALMADLWWDLRYASRSFLRNPGLAAAIVMILGIGVGSVTLMFSVLNTAVLHPLPYEEPDRLVWLWGTSEDVPRNGISYEDLLDYREGTTAFQALSGYTVFGESRVLTGTDRAEQLQVGRVTANFFSTLGVRPELGRSFLPTEEQSDIETVAVLSHALWIRRFSGDPGAVGSVVSLDSRPVEVVGVMPAWFDLPSGSDLWVPIQQAAVYSQGRGNNSYYCVGRLRDDVSMDQAQAQLDAVAAAIGETFPDVKAGWGIRVVSLHERFFGEARGMLMVLLGVIALVPLVACANIASLLLARASGRATEMASRMAFGASRSRLARQLLTENLLLALGGGLLGLGLAWVGGRVLSSFAPDALPRLDAIGIDGGVLAFTLLASLLTVPLFGVLPVFRTTDVNISQELKVGGSRGASVARSGFRHALVVAQVALSLMLLAASGLLIRSYRNLHDQDLGFRVQGLLQARIGLPAFKYDTYEEVEADWVEIFRLLESSPAVASMAAVDRPPLTGYGPTNDVWAAERPPADATSRTDATRRYVTEGYFDVMGIRLTSGRDFQTSDVRSSEEDPPVIINQALAERFFPGENPLGKTLVFDYDVIRNLEIVGTVSDVKEGDPGAPVEPTFYLPNRWRPRLSMTFVVRPNGHPADLATAFKEAVEAANPSIPPPTIEPMEDRLADVLFQPRFRLTLVGAFSMVTLILSAVGLYGVLSFFARSRRRELGIRLALGAGRRKAAHVVLRQGMTLVGWGVGIGLVGSLIGARAIQSWLFGVDTTDPGTLGGVSLFLVGVSCVACLIPTLRSMKVNPVEVLKEE